MEKYIVAEITKNWDSSTHVSNLISQQFENVININAKRGYKLIDWKFSAINNGSVHTETIVAIFEAVEQSQMNEAVEVMRLLNNPDASIPIEGVSSFCELEREARERFPENNQLHKVQRMIWIQRQYNSIQSELNKLKAKNEEWEKSFELYHSADLRGIEMFRKGNPDYPELNYPDKGELVAWLLEQFKSIQSENERLKSDLDIATR